MVGFISINFENLQNNKTHPKEIYFYSRYSRFVNNNHSISPLLTGPFATLSRRQSWGGDCPSYDPVTGP